MYTSMTLVRAWQGSFQTSRPSISRVTGSFLCLLHALVKLALLYSYRRRSLPLVDAEWAECLRELAHAHSLAGTIANAELNGFFSEDAKKR